MSFIINKIGSLQKEKRLIENMFFSVFAHVVNYLFPLVTFPYLVRTLGINEFGNVTFAQTIANYFATVVMFGFYLTGTNAIAQMVNDNTKQNQVFHEILFARLYLSIVCFFILLIAILVVDKFHQRYELFLFSFLIVVGWVFQSEFFFQGIQQMKLLSIANLISRFFTLAIILVEVKSPQDTSFAVLSYGIGGLISSLFCFVLAYKKYDLSWHIPNWQAIKKQFINGYHVFLSAVAVNLYSSSINLIILGFITNSLLVGHYSIADRIFILLCSLSIPISQTLFPFLSELSISNYPKYIRYSKAIIAGFLLSFILMSFLVYYTAPFLIEIIAGRRNTQAEEVLKILSLCMPMYPLGFTYTNLFIIHHKKKYITLLNGILVIVNLVLVYPLLNTYGIKGLAINNFIVFLAMTLIGFYIIKSKNIIQPINSTYEA